MTERGTRVHAALLVFLAVLLSATSGCSAISDRFGGDDEQASTIAADVGLETVSWGVFDQTASVLVRNDTDMVLRRGDAVVRVLDRQGTTLATSASMPEQGQCCSAMNVPPGGTYGFYFAIGQRGDQIDDVQVDYSDVAWSVDTGGAAVTGEPVELYSDDTGAVAVADLTTTGGTVDEAVVQARLDDADGNFLAIVSGRWTCLEPGAPTRAFLQLFHEVPADTVLASVSVFPVVDATLDPTAAAGSTCG